MDARYRRSNPARRQRGSIAMFGALGIGVMVIMLSLLDIGFLYYYQREYQKAADFGALAGASRLHEGCAEAKSRADEHAIHNLGSVGRESITPVCGIWRRNETPSFVIDESDDANAVRVRIMGTVPRFFVPGDRQISATGIALSDQAVAALTIRSELVSVDTEQSLILNAVVGGLLGGSINLGVSAWQGLLDTNINLLSYLDALALHQGLTVGNYDAVLNNQTSVGDLLSVAVDVLEQGNGTGSIGAGISGLESLLIALPPGTPLLRLGDFVSVHSGVESAGLDTSLNALQLVQGVAQLASGDNVADVDLTLLLPGVTGTIKVGVIESPQLSAVGNPEFAAADPLGDDRIYVRTAQVRTLVSMDLPIAGTLLSSLTDLLNNEVITVVTETVNNLLTLDLVALVSTLSCLVACDFERDVTDIEILATPRVDLNVDAGGGEAWVSDYSCNDDDKSLTVPVRTSSANIRIGHMGATAADAAAQVFSSTDPPQVEPVPLIDIGTRRVRYTCTLLLICSVRWWSDDINGWVSNKSNSTRIAFAGGGIGLRVNLAVAATQPSPTPHFSDPPEDGLPALTFGGMPQAPAWQKFSTNNIVNSLANSFSGLDLVFYEPVNNNALGGVIYLAGSTLQPLVDALAEVISGELSPLLDPLVDLLADSLGVDVNAVEVGANMTCSSGGGVLVN